MDNFSSLIVMSPEVVLTLCGLVLLLVGLLPRANVTRVTTYLTIVAFVGTGVTLFCPARLHGYFNGQTGYAFHSMFVDDAFARFVKVMLLVAGSFTLLMSTSYLEKEKLDNPEYPVLILFATLGMMLMVSAMDMLSLYVGLELQSLALYVLAAFRRDNAKSSEAGLKYFVLGALSSGLVLYGISLVYGYAGTTDFITIGFALLHAPAHSIGLIFGMVFVLAAMAFKVSAVPFHMWTPDVYEGAPTPVTAFFGAGPKIAALVLLVRLLHAPFIGMTHQWDQILVFIALASMLLGCFAGLVQTNLKRLMAYSSIANVGFALTGLAVVNKSGVDAMMIYLAIYFINVLGVFGVILCLRRDGEADERISALAGLGKTNPLLALAMMIFMFSLAGVPPLAGFIGKYLIFLAAVGAHMVPLAIIGVLTSVVSAFYYLRVVKIMYFDEPIGKAIDPLPDFGLRAVVAISALSMLVFTVVPSPLVDRAVAAVTSYIPG